MKKEYLLLAAAGFGAWYFLGGSGGQVPSFGGFSPSSRGGGSGYDRSATPTCCSFKQEPDDYSDASSQRARYNNRANGRGQRY